MKLHDLKTVLNEIAPLDTQEDWDNSGMQICQGNKDIKKILVAMEITSAVVDEAVENKVDLVITHHPMLFVPVKKICPGEPTGRYIISLIKNDISVYSCHTPFDKVRGGLNDYFLKQLGLTGIKKLNDYVRIGSLKKAVKLSAFANSVAKLSGVPEGVVRVSGNPDRLIRKAAVCTGAGADMYEDALDAGADVYISGDIKHHLVQKAKEQGMCFIDATHWGTERQFVDDFTAMLGAKVKGIKIIKSKADQNPFDFTV